MSRDRSRPRYLLVEAESEQEIVDLVAKKQRYGWRVAGGISRVMFPDFSQPNVLCISYMQAMERPPKNRPEEAAAPARPRLIEFNGVTLDGDAVVAVEAAGPAKTGGGADVWGFMVAMGGGARVFIHAKPPALRETAPTTQEWLASTQADRMAFCRLVFGVPGAEIQPYKAPES